MERYEPRMRKGSGEVDRVVLYARLVVFLCLDPSEIPSPL